MIFTFEVMDNQNNVSHLKFDSMTYTLMDENGNPFDYSEINKKILAGLSSGGGDAFYDCKLKKDDTIKSSAPRQIRYSLGLACNYNCQYCKQDHFLEKPIFNEEKTRLFIENLQKYISLENLVSFQFWGGEPLLYWDEIKYLHDKLIKIKPSLIFGIIMNGSLITEEMVEYLSEPFNNFKVSLSHDGIGQCLRGGDPLKEGTLTHELIIKLNSKLVASDSFNISCTLTKANTDLDKLAEYFNSVFGEDNIHVKYDVLMVDNCLQQNCVQSIEDVHLHSRRILEFMLKCKYTMNNGFMPIVSENLLMLSSPTYKYDPTKSRCFATSKNILVLDVDGNVLPCQSYTATHVTPDGDSVVYGNISDMSKLTYPKIQTALTRSKDCLKCPIVAQCAGGCPFSAEHPEYHETECGIKFHHYMGLLTYAIYVLTDKIMTKCYGDFHNAVNFDD